MVSLMNKSILIILILLNLAFSCKSENKESVSEIKTITNGTIHKNDSLTFIFNSNKQYIKDSLLNEKSGIVDDYFLRYQSDTCGVLTHKNSELKEMFKGIRIIKGIKTDKKTDTVFVMPSFNYCDEGESYCFYDKTLPRLHTDSYCCHSENFFVCNDIDEDGFNEVGIFYSSCVGRYKSLKIYSLKKNAWQEIYTSIFDIMTKNPNEVEFSDLVKKLSKNKFQICSFSEGQTKWETVKM